jgi:hypothetical protein
MTNHCDRHITHLSDNEAKIKNKFVSPYPTDPVKIGRLNFFYWLGFFTTEMCSGMQKYRSFGETNLKCGNFSKTNFERNEEKK